MYEGLYIGLMSGTSIDAIDAVLVEVGDNYCQFIAHYQQSWPDTLQQQIRALTHPGQNEIDQLGVVDILVAEQFATAAIALLDQQQLSAEQIIAIGSHGQTIRHRPEHERAFTLQIGDPNQIAELTSIMVVGDFRRRDMAAGGQGAPLAPAFHAAQFASDSEDRVALNLGGIANITVIPAGSADQSIGFDTGTANTLMDLWTHQHLNTRYDENGEWAKSGVPDTALLGHLLTDSYFSRPAPKSTGTEYFSRLWLA
ncbi:MAG: anhydro-N-acetylmuramic acid kinase, partial [Chromatiales bacterium]|nr:anhydro-N-acetylmuramic acid kinase [Chromatiales bacterium]